MKGDAQLLVDLAEKWMSGFCRPAFVEKWMSGFWKGDAQLLVDLAEKWMSGFCPVRLLSAVEAKRVLFEELAQLYEHLLKMQQAQVEVGILEPNEYRRSKVQLLEIQMLQLQLSP